MILESRPHNWSYVPWVLFFLLGYINAVLIIYHYSRIPKLFHNEVPAIPALFSLVLAILAFTSVALMLADKSRLTGFFVITTQVPLIFYNLFLADKGHALIMGDFFSASLIIGAVIVTLSLYKIRFDLLGLITRFLLYFSFLYYLLILVVAIVLGLLRFSSVWDVFIFAIMIGTMAGYLYYVHVILKDITSSNVFIFGPTGSGKSVFLTALYLDLNQYYQGETPYEVLVSIDPEYETELSLNIMAHKMQTGKPLRGTRMNEFALYDLPCKKWGFLPIHISSLDYAGGFAVSINRQEYSQGLYEVSHAIHQSQDELEKNLSNNNFLTSLKENHFNEFVSFINQIGFALLFNKLKKAGKIIFLIDGGIYNYNPKSQELNDYLNKISTLIDQLGGNKDYTFIVTKADRIAKVGKYIKSTSQHSAKARKLEKIVFQDLYKNNFTFRGIIRRIDAHPILNPKKIHCFLVSVDASKREHDEIAGYHPWRMDLVVENIMRF